MTEPRETSDTLVVIPTYNERDNIAGLIGQILALPTPCHVLVVDDSSPDGTGQIVRDLMLSEPRLQLVSTTERKGYGGSILIGFRQALASGYKYVITMDADFSHDPQYLPSILAALKSDADLVIGSRYTNGISIVNWPLQRLLLSLMANRYLRLITGLPLSDCTSGYKGISCSVLQAFDLDTICSNGYSFTTEINYLSYKRGFRLKEVPIIFIERRSGGSKMSFAIMLEALLVPWRLRFKS